jgi:hypothetical protein
VRDGARDAVLLLEERVVAARWRWRGLARHGRRAALPESAGDHGQVPPEHVARVRPAGLDVAVPEVGRAVPEPGGARVGGAPREAGAAAVERGLGGPEAERAQRRRHPAAPAPAAAGAAAVPARRRKGAGLGRAELEWRRGHAAEEEALLV